MRCRPGSRSLWEATPDGTVCATESAGNVWVVVTVAIPIVTTALSGRGVGSRRHRCVEGVPSRRERGRVKAVESPRLRLLCGYVVLVNFGRSQGLRPRRGASSLTPVSRSSRALEKESPDPGAGPLEWWWEGPSSSGPGDCPSDPVRTVVGPETAPEHRRVGREWYRGVPPGAGDPTS